MRYVNDTVRRRDRLMDEVRARELLRDSEYGVLSMIDENGIPYGIPVNHVWNGEDSIYIHCAPEGFKLRAIAKHSSSWGVFICCPISSRQNMRVCCSEVGHMSV